MVLRSASSSMVLVPAVVAVSLAFTPADGDHAAPTWSPQQHGATVFLQASSSAGWSSASAPTTRNHLPSSALPGPPNPVPMCSVDTTDLGTPPVCSTSASTLRCSARCDSDERCSAFFNTAGVAPLIACSTLGGPGQQRCSVLQPMLTIIAPSMCSAEMGIPGTEILCSVLAPGGGKACSAENPPILQGNFCSTLRTPVMGGRSECSVLNGGAFANNFCSVGLPPDPAGSSKTCSTFQIDSECSIRMGQRGTCTHLVGAPAGTCSVFNPPSNCSVIGGPSGTLCTLP